MDRVQLPTQAALVDPDLTRVETICEAATFVILGAIGWVKAETWRRRLAAFVIVLTVCDLTLCLFLRVLDGGPASAIDREVFFLVPVAWVGPVLTALVLSTLVLGAASWAYLRAEPPRQRRHGGTSVGAMGRSGRVRNGALVALGIVGLGAAVLGLLFYSMYGGTVYWYLNNDHRWYYIHPALYGATAVVVIVAIVGGARGVTSPARPLPRVLALLILVTLWASASTALGRAYAV
jgi:hypothetical protein